MDVKETVSCLRELGSLCMKVADKIRSVPKEVRSIQGDLNRIQASIVDAAEEDPNRDLVEKVKQMKKTVFSIEDVIDEYQNCDGCHDPGCGALPRDTTGFMKTVVLYLVIAWKIQGIKSEVLEIEESRKKSDAGSKVEPSLEQTQSSRKGNPDISWKNLRELPLRMDESDFEGLGKPSAKLIDWLKNEGADCALIKVVVGMGGLGKTTLARKVFKNQEVIGLFECHAWITVSKFSDKEKLFEDMLNQFCKRKPLPQTSPTEPKSFKDKVEEYLKGTRYVVFFDDVWSDHFWEEIRFVVDNKKPGSKIIITTRNKGVASTCMKSSRAEELEIEPLTEEESLKLFHKTAFLNRPDGPNQHRAISSVIVRKCMHLPLGIVAIGREIAADRNFPIEWNRHIQKNADIAKILSLSYDDLPEYLKPCLLYFGMYPENHEVKSKRLIRQWIAEGFVISEKRKTLEEVAKGYLQELIDRSLVQVSSFTIDGKARSCSVHYLVRAMILRIFEDLSFCQFISEDDRLDKEDIIRRLSIAFSSQGGFGIFQNSASLLEYSFMRSLLFFTTKELDVSEYTRSTLTKCVQLKVLDFEGALLCNVPEIIENSIKLKYLSFRNTEVKGLPNSIGKLQNLETLDLRQTSVNEIPKDVNKLRKLRHLLGADMSLIQLKDGIGDMESLQTLYSVKIDDNDGLELIEKLGKLEQMRDLGLTNVMKEHGSSLCSSLNKMQDLEKLHIVAKTEKEIDLQNLEKRSKLRKLHLQGKLSSLPEWIPQLEYLLQLVLSMSKLARDPLHLLKNIPCLRFLSIIDEGYEGASLHFQGEGFYYLKELELGSLHSLNSIIIDSEALPSLNKLELRHIPQLKMVPSGIQHLKNLEVLNIGNMPAEFAHSIALDARQEDRIIKPHVRIIKASP